jgi:hypothetical protein
MHELSTFRGKKILPQHAVNFPKRQFLGKGMAV